MRNGQFVSALAFAAVLAAPALANAQVGQRQPAQVPIGLVTALVALPFGRGPRATQVVVGMPPNGVAPSNLPSKPVSVLGGMASGSVQSVVFICPATDRDPAASYMTFLESVGWRRPTPPPARGGFVSMDENHVRSAWLCRNSARVTVLPIAGAPSGSVWVRADVYPERGSSACGAQPRSDFMQDFVFPTLEDRPVRARQAFPALAEVQTVARSPRRSRRP